MDGYTGGMLEKRLETIEELLRKQNRLAGKGRWSRPVLCVLLLCMVLVLAAGLYMVNETLSGAADGLTELAETAQVTLEDADLRAITAAIGELESGLRSVETQELTDSIRRLIETLEPLTRAGAVPGA